MNIKGNETSEVINAEKRDLQIFKSLLECFHISRRGAGVEPNIIQLTIKYSENKYERIVELKATSGVNYIFYIIF
jgi:hypothetical protein